MSYRNHFLLVAVLMGCILSSCELVEPDPSITDEVNDCRKVWEDAEIHNYTLTYHEICLCEDEYVSVTVVNQEIVMIQITDQDGELQRDVPASLFSNYRDVEGFFDYIENLDGQVDELAVVFNPYIGIPEHIDINFDKDLTDLTLDIVIELTQID